MELVIEHLQKHFEGKLVLRDIHFRFEQGKIYGLLGRNGAGKTTLFNCINQDIEIDGGRFYIEDEGRRPVTMSDIGSVSYTHLDVYKRQFLYDNAGYGFLLVI